MSASGAVGAPADAVPPRTAREAFAAIDRNDDGHISRAEVLTALRAPEHEWLRASLGLPARIRQEDEARAEFERVFQAMDGDDDKAIDIDEWARYLGEREWARHLSKRPLAEQLAEMKARTAQLADYNSVCASMRAAIQAAKAGGAGKASETARTAEVLEQLSAHVKQLLSSEIENARALNVTSSSAATELHGAAARMRAVLNESVRAGLVATGDREKLRQLAQSADAPAAVKGLSELHERIPKVAAQATAKDEIAALLGAT